MLEIKKAVRRALPLQIGFYGPSGSGKTMSALLFAAGLAGPGGRVVVIDTERGRASLFSDNKRVMGALPQGYDVVELDAPNHTKRFIEALDLVEKEGYKVCLIDSESDAWDGPGGCSDLAEENKGRWNKPKLWNKRYKMRINFSDMHVISLFKAQEKSKIIDKKFSDSGKEEVISLGMMPIMEKNNFYPLLLGFSVDPKTHISTAVKYHEDLGYLFKEPKLITKEDGDKVRMWNMTGSAPAEGEQLDKRAAFAALGGVESYKAFFAGLSAPQRKLIRHDEHKAAAVKVDSERFDAVAEVEQLPDAITVAVGTRVRQGGKLWVVEDIGDDGHRWIEGTGAAA